MKLGKCCFDANLPHTYVINDIKGRRKLFSGTDTFGVAGVYGSYGGLTGMKYAGLMTRTLKTVEVL